ncbi:heterokaryon incompatibility protein [Colletotrichum kahawae]|uniref:Heterokaryon incompatibility protein n=1 Tax=Colletotrichum kahawae TaxID=34407 RepID=A0AAE0DCL0_COLKA|nr:heterokaryon incompatibility protein [Colletotrichum kahawae]
MYWPKKGDLFGKELDIAPVDHSTGSPETVQRAVDWYQSCQLSHGKCSSLPTRGFGWLPSRLIDIGQAEDDNWKLVITAENAGKLLDVRYATLSYRWGLKPQALMLNTLTVGGFLGGNPIANLPKTFKEFIVVSRKLGFRYVWIDCLCIIQDCSQDWNQEAPTMRDVYANSGCNILACDSSDPGGGLFRFRNPNDLLPGLVETNLSSGQPQRYIVRDGMLRYRLHYDVKTLADRGWVFQERFLAPRLLSFHGQRISWECCEGREWERLYQGFESSISIMEELLASTQQSAEAPHGQMTEATKNLWVRVVMLYSQCKLTKSEDKLLAFVGVAKVFQELTGDTYLAGIWKSQLYIQLDWHTSGHLTKLPRRYRAPSWSWASVDSPVEIQNQYFESSEGWITEDPTFLEILGVSVTANAFGGMADASDGGLKVRGKCFRCSYEKKASHSYIGESFLIRPDGDFGVELMAGVQVDATEYELAGEGRTTLLLHAVSPCGIYRFEAMILQPHSSSENSYRRAGWASGTVEDLEGPASHAWFEQIANTELTFF